MLTNYSGFQLRGDGLQFFSTATPPPPPIKHHKVFQYCCPPESTFSVNVAGPPHKHTTPLLRPTTVVPSYVLRFSSPLLSSPSLPSVAYCATHIQHQPPTSPNPLPHRRPIPTNAPHFSRSCGIKIRAGTQLRALAGIAAPCPHYGVLLNRPTDRT